MRRHRRSPTLAMQPAGQDPEAAPGARNGHSTAPFADECQSFLDNVMAGLGRIGAWNYPNLDPGEHARCHPNLRFQSVLAAPYRWSSRLRIWGSGVRILFGRATQVIEGEGKFPGTGRRELLGWQAKELARNRDGGLQPGLPGGPPERVRGRATQAELHAYANGCARPTSATRRKPTTDQRRSLPMNEIARAIVVPEF